MAWIWHGNMDSMASGNAMLFFINREGPFDATMYGLLGHVTPSHMETHVLLALPEQWHAVLPPGDITCTSVSQAKAAWPVVQRTWAAAKLCPPPELADDGPNWYGVLTSAMVIKLIGAQGPRLQAAAYCMIGVIHAAPPGMKYLYTVFPPGVSTLQAIFNVPSTNMLKVAHILTPLNRYISIMVAICLSQQEGTLIVNVPPAPGGPTLLSLESMRDKRLGVGARFLAGSCGSAALQEKDFSHPYTQETRAPEWLLDVMAYLRKGDTASHAGALAAFMATYDVKF